MPMSPEVQTALSGTKPGGQMPPQSPPPGPAAAGMMTPQKPSGQIENGRLKIHVIMKSLEQTLSMFEIKSPEWKSVLDTLKSLSKTFGKQEGDSQELLPSEQKSMAGSPPPGAPPGGSPGAPPPGMPAPGGAPPPGM